MQQFPRFDAFRSVTETLFGWPNAIGLVSLTEGKKDTRENPGDSPDYDIRGRVTPDEEAESCYI